MANGFDCATKLNITAATELKKAGFEYVARYLGNSWKTFDVNETNIIKNAGLKLISIFEKNSTQRSYFTKAQGMSDAQEAYKFAKSVGQPAGSAIYFTVDYDAQPGDMPAIIEYLNGVKQLLVDYKVGIYGSYAVMMAVKGQVDYYWQTYAWSHGQVADFINMRQYQNSVTVAGVQLDKDEIRKDPGAWGQSQPYRVIIPNTAFWQAKNLVIEFEQRGFTCRGVNLKVYKAGQQPAEGDPYEFVIDTDLDTARQLVIELETRGYDRTYGEPR
jgi:hypothetical protein